MAEKMDTNRDRKEIKKSSNAPPIIIVSLLIVIAVIVVIALTNSNGSMTGKVVSDSSSGQQDTQTSQNCRDVQVPYEKQVTDSKTVQYTEQECETKQLSYRSSDEGDQMKREVVCIEDHKECKESHENFWGNIVCDREETICDEYRETASFEITNLDNERGSWSFEWRASCRANQPLCNINNFEKLAEYGLLIDPTETKSSSYSITYDTKGQKFLYVYFTYIPTKQICRDITKYKEVPETKTIIEYKTEQKCD